MNKGFSLIELTFVLLIVSILTLMAVPNYTRYLTQTRRLDGQTALLMLANQIESQRMQHHKQPYAPLPTHSQGGWYTLQVNQLPGHHYQLLAKPIQSQARYDTTCQTLSLTDRGEQSIAPGISGNPTGSAAACWM